MKRQVPKNYGNLTYIVTIQGSQGNLEALAECIKSSNIVSADLISPSMSNVRAYWAVKKEEVLEFDVYSPKGVVEGSKPVTSTSSFRRGLGELTTLMLQAGYTLSVKKVDLPKLPGDGLKF